MPNKQKNKYEIVEARFIASNAALGKRCRILPLTFVFRL